MEDNKAIDNHSDAMEAQENCQNLNKVQDNSDCQLPNEIAKKNPDDDAQEVSESSLKKSEDTFKVPAAVLKVKMGPSKLTTRPAGDCSHPGPATKADKSADAVADDSISGGDLAISQSSPSSDGFLIPSNVAPQPPAAAGLRPSRGPAVQLSSKAGSSVERSAAGAAAAYRPPAWAGCPPHAFSLEVVRGGRVVETVALQERACSVFGRLPDCHVQLQHPSISRHHAALVYRASGDDGRETGYYLYDLGSTHGTTLNKTTVQPKVYCRMRVGHMCKFGSSTRFFVLQGPEEDREEESPLSVTELRQLGQQREQQRHDRLEALDDPETETETAPTAAHAAAADGISWGMAEDADEESDLQFNPFALGEAQNEQLYLVDPKKTLRGWFEREGLELEYRTEELAGQRHICRVTLPLDSVDGRPPVAEAQQVGKKKEAVFQCALEACRLLDRAGVLRQAKQEGRQNRQRKPAGYDSDEDDSFLDRTGAVERKRQRRQQGAHIEPKADTYQSLLAQYQKVQSEALAVERRLQNMEAVAQAQAEPAADGDELDAFMTRLSQDAFSGRQQKRKLKGELTQLRTEEGRLCRLVNLTRPASLPPLKPPPQAAAAARAPLTGFIGRRKGKVGAASGPAAAARVSAAAPGGEEGAAGRPAPPGDAAARLAPGPDPDRQRVPDGDEMDTERSREAADADCRGLTAPEPEPGDHRDTTAPPAHRSVERGAERRPALPDRADCITTEVTVPEATAVTVPEATQVTVPEATQVTVPEATQVTVPEATAVTVPEATAGGDASSQQQQKDATGTKRKRQSKDRRPAKQVSAAVDSYSERAGDGTYDVWMPPEGQSGDGRTSLNDKLGY